MSHNWLQLFIFLSYFQILFNNQFKIKTFIFRCRWIRCRNFGTIITWGTTSLVQVFLVHAMFGTKTIFATRCFGWMGFLLHDFLVPSTLGTNSLGNTGFWCKYLSCIAFGYNIVCFQKYFGITYFDAQILGSTIECWCNVYYTINLIHRIFAWSLNGIFIMCDLQNEFIGQNRFSSSIRSGNVWNFALFFLQNDEFESIIKSWTYIKLCYTVYINA
jgi:hypothetical protein